MKITTAQGTITRSTEKLKSAWYSPSRGLCVEYEDNTGLRTLTNVKKIEV